MSVLSGTVYAYASMNLPAINGNYFEIGVFNGSGFALVAKENPNRKCFAVDPFIEDGHTTQSSGVAAGDQLSQQKQNFLANTVGLDNITLFEMTSAKYAEQLTDQMCKDMDIGMVTIDGDHHYENVVIDFEIAARLIGKKSGRIIVDDLDVAGVDRAYREFLETFKDRVDKTVPADGATYVILIKESNDSN